jgi:hypothetical protein
MRQVKVTAASKVARRFAVIACVAILGVGAAACGDDSVVTPQAPTGGSTPAGVTTPAPGETTPIAGGSGF